MAHLGSLAIFLGFIYLLVQTVSGSNNIVDLSSRDTSIKSELCHNNADRISRISDIIQLLNQIKFQQDNCIALWRKPLRDLQDVLEASAKDACSQETIDKIYEFHWYYIVGTLKKSWRKASRAAIPEPLRLFFLHFAEETARKCQHHLSERLSRAVKSSTSLEEVDALAKGTFGVTLDALSFAPVKRNNVKRYDDFFLIFDSILAAERKKGYEVEKWVDPENGELIYMPVKVSNATSSRLVQQICREKLRPVYANTVQPVMRLIDMGFGSRSERIHDDQVRGWFGFAQLCELALPVKFYSSGAVKAGQVALMAEEKAEKLGLRLVKSMIASKRVPNIEVSPVHLEDVLKDAGDDHVVEQVRSGLKNRGRIYRRTLKNCQKKIKSDSQAFFGDIFVFRKSGYQEIETEKTIAEAERFLADEDSEGDELVRSKRCIHLRGRKLSMVDQVVIFILVLMLVPTAVGLAFG